VGGLSGLHGDPPLRIRNSGGGTKGISVLHAARGQPTADRGRGLLGAKPPYQRDQECVTAGKPGVLYCDRCAPVSVTSFAGRAGGRPTAKGERNGRKRQEGSEKSALSWTNGPRPSELEGDAGEKFPSLLQTGERIKREKETKGPALREANSERGG